MPPTLAIDYLRGSEESDDDYMRALQQRDLDGSLVALHKIHSLIPDLGKMDRLDLLQLLVDNVVYNDDDLVVINKPYGLSVTDGPGLSVSINSLLDELRPMVTHRGQQPLLPAHRIDRCTTGLLILAAGRLRWSEMRDMYNQKAISKSYLCITKMVPNPHSGTIRAAVGEKKMGQQFKIIPLLIDDGKQEGKYRRHKADARMVETQYEVIKEGAKCAFVKCTSQSGAKHQIRTHLGLSLGTPILGDHKYSSFFGCRPQRLPIEVLHRLNVRPTKARHLPMYLHASEIEIPNFKDKRTLRLRAELPKFFAYTLKRLHL